jgi:maltooligosyltrehalose trehalohydrolase
MASHRFRVWAPEKEKLTLHVIRPFEARLEMSREDDGFFTVDVEGAGPGTRYAFVLDDEKEYPDPGSHFQPEGVHGPSELVGHAEYPWRVHEWAHRPFGEWVIYELHVGTFTPEGTFEAVIPRLEALVELGVNAIELMPVAQFPGTRNWGYDTAYPYAVQNSYGGPAGLKVLVDACHERGIVVILDVVYNHLGPEGSYMPRFGPYFTEEYRNPWGAAVNLDGPWSDGVRAFLIENIRHWFAHYRIDALRVDAIHTMHDKSAISIWEEIHRRREGWQREAGRPFLLIAESDLNNPRVVATPEQGGFGFDAQWLDDFHHALYVLVHPEGKRHYEDFGSLEQLAKAYTDGFVHSGEYVRFRKRRHGASSAGVRGDRFVVFNQNHDQIGNRILGERLSLLVDAEHLKVAAAALLLAPYVPLLFMGEEYGERAPFLFFADYGDPEVSRGMQEGRKREFEAFKWTTGADSAEPPDPLDPDTFARSKLRWEIRREGSHLELQRWHSDLLALRTQAPFRNFSKYSVSAAPVEGRGMMLRRVSAGRDEEALILFNFSGDDLAFALPNKGAWTRVLDSRAVGKELTDVTDGVRDSVTIPGWSAVVLSRRSETP